MKIVRSILCILYAWTKNRLLSRLCTRNIWIYSLNYYCSPKRLIFMQKSNVSINEILHPSPKKNPSLNFCLGCLCLKLSTFCFVVSAVLCQHLLWEKMFVIIVDSYFTVFLWFWLEKLQLLLWVLRTSNSSAR